MNLFERKPTSAVISNLREELKHQNMTLNCRYNSDTKLTIRVGYNGHTTSSKVYCGDASIEYVLTRAVYELVGRAKERDLFLNAFDVNAQSIVDYMKAQWYSSNIRIDIMIAPKDKTICVTARKAGFPYYVTGEHEVKYTGSEGVPNCKLIEAAHTAVYKLSQSMNGFEIYEK